MKAKRQQAKAAGRARWKDLNTEAVRARRGQSGERVKR
jgi:hypothetical protein